MTDLKHILLGHLSEENNYPELAYQAVRNEINFSPDKYQADNLDIRVASRVKPSCLVEFLIKTNILCVKKSHREVF